MYDIIHRKRLGEALSRKEIRDVIEGFVRGDVPDYQMSALAMAIVFRGMNEEETAELTMAMAESGQVLDLSDIPGVKVDKHSTGGVGDTTTLVLAPLVAALGVPVAKMSGRGLGHTGGTIDKLESIPGFSAELSIPAFKEQVRRIGLAVAAQTLDLAPADKKLYALRDVTDTVESIPLIASSIMSKKLASGADAIVLDVKVGAGAFMKDIESARELARTMVAIGERAGRRVVALLTQMEEPLGRAVGNALEVREAIQTLRGQGPSDLTELCLAIGAEMLVLAGRAKTVDEARSELRAALADGRALEKFKAFIAAQGGDPRVADDLSLLPKAPVVRTYNAPVDGVVRRIQAEQAGLIAMRLGAGRARRDDRIDPAVGLIFLRKTGQQVIRGEPLVEVHAATEAAAEEALGALAECISVGEGEPFEPPLILGTVRAGTAAVIAGEDELVAQAQAARERAYVPYSGFAVGAALRLRDGTIVTGANIENASYGLTNCAERTALFKAVFDHGRPAGAHGGSGTPSALGATGCAAEVGRRTLPDIEAVAVIADSNGPVAPCGACRQVLAEFCRPETPVVLADLSGRRLRTTVGALLPHAFGSEQMGRNDNHAQIPE